MATFTHEKTNNEIVCPEDPKTKIWVQVYLGSDARKNQEDTGKRARKRDREWEGAHTRCADGQVTAAGKWDSVCLGTSGRLYRAHLGIEPISEGQRSCTILPPNPIRCHAKAISSVESSALLSALLTGRKSSGGRRNPQTKSCSRLQWEAAGARVGGGGGR